jgi:hypothetical protein
MNHRHDLLIGLGAVLISAVSLIVAVSSNRTEERLLAASTWPYVQYGTSNRGDDGSDLISLTIDNSGVGPARIKTFEVVYDGKPQPDAMALLKTCCGGAGKQLTTVTSSTEGVLKAGEASHFLRFPTKDNPPEVWQQFNKERFKVSVRACYCSVLGDCWTIDSAKVDADPASVEVCPALPRETRWHG